MARSGPHWSCRREFRSKAKASRHWAPSRLQASIFDVTGKDYKITSPAPDNRAPPEPQPTERSEEDGPRIESIPPPGYDRNRYVLLGLMLGVLALGFAAQYLKGSRAQGMSALAVSSVWKYYGDFPALRDISLRGAARPLRRTARPQRRRQNDAAAHPRRPLASVQGRRQDLRRERAGQAHALARRHDRPRHRHLR